MSKKANPIEVVFLILLAAGVLLGIWVHCSGCTHDGCEPGDQRCQGINVETCNGDEDWYVSEHCDAVEPIDLNWTCCWVETEGVVACVPAAECKPVDGGDDGN